MMPSAGAPGHGGAPAGPSPCYLNDPTDGCVGGFERADIEGLIDAMESNRLRRDHFLAPVVMGSQSPSESTRELQASFCVAAPCAEGLPCGLVLMAIDGTVLRANPAPPRADPPAPAGSRTGATPPSHVRRAGPA